MTNKVKYEIHKLRFDRDDDYIDAVLATLNRFKYHIYPDTWVDVNNPKSGEEAHLKEIEVYTTSSVFKNYSVAERRARLYYRAWTQCNMAKAAFSFTKEWRPPDTWLDCGIYTTGDIFRRYSFIKGVDECLMGLWMLFAKPTAIKELGIVEYGFPGQVEAVRWNYYRMKTAMKIALKASPKDDQLEEAAQTVQKLIIPSTYDVWLKNVCGVDPPYPDIPLDPDLNELDLFPDQVVVSLCVIPIASSEGLSPNVEFVLNTWYLYWLYKHGPVKGKAPAPKPWWMQGTGFHKAYLTFTKRLNKIAMKLWNRYVNTEIPEIDADEPVLTKDLKNEIKRSAYITGFGRKFPFCGTFAAQLVRNLYVHLAAYLLEVVACPGGVSIAVREWCDKNDIPTIFQVRSWREQYLKWKQKYLDAREHLDNLYDEFADYAALEEKTQEDIQRMKEIYNDIQKWKNIVKTYRRKYKYWLRKYRYGVKKILQAKKVLAEGLKKTVRAYRRWSKLITKLKLRAYSACIMAARAIAYLIKCVKRRATRWAAWRRFCLITCYNIGVKRLLRAQQLVERSLALRRAYEHIVRRKKKVRLTPKNSAAKDFRAGTRDEFYKRFVKVLFKATLSTHFLKFEDDPNNFERWDFNIVIGGAYPLRKTKPDLKKWPKDSARPKALIAALKVCGKGLKPPNLTNWGRNGGQDQWSGIWLERRLSELNDILIKWEREVYNRVQNELKKIKIWWDANPLEELNVPKLQGEYLVKKYKS